MLANELHNTVFHHVRLIAPDGRTCNHLVQEHVEERVVGHVPPEVRAQVVHVHLHLLQPELAEGAQSDALLQALGEKILFTVAWGKIVA